MIPFSSGQFTVRVKSGRVMGIILTDPWSPVKRQEWTNLL